MLTYSKIQWSTQDTAISENTVLFLFYFYLCFSTNTNALFNIQDAAATIFSIISHLLKLYCRWYWDPNVLRHNICWTIQVVMHKSLKMTWRNQTLNSGVTKDIFLLFKISSPPH